MFCQNQSITNALTLILSYSFSLSSHKHTCAVHTADTVCMLQSVFMQVSVQAEASPPVATDPLQLGQVHRVTGRRPSSVALGDAINRRHALTGRSIGGTSLKPIKTTAI